MKTNLNNALAGQEFNKLDVTIFQESIKQWDLDNDGKISFDEFAKIMSVKLDKLAKDNLSDAIQLTADSA